VVGQLGRGEAEIERARRGDVECALDRAGPAREPALLFCCATQVRERRRREPAVDLVERASSADGGERGRERPLSRSGVMHVVGGDHVDGRRCRQFGQRVVAVPVERVAVVPQLDQHAVAAERGNEPVEGAPGRGGAIVEKRARDRALAASGEHEPRVVGARRGAAQVNRRTGSAGEGAEIEAGRALLPRQLRCAHRSGQAGVPDRALREH
jgi:hypothetical protein